MFASVAILEDVANFKWGDVGGAPEQSPDTAHKTMKMLHAECDVQSAYYRFLTSSQCRMMGEGAAEVASWLIVAGHSMRVEET